MAINMILSAADSAAEASHDRVRAMSDNAEDVLSNCPDCGSNVDIVVVAYRKVTR